jgi:hypothetical protein
VQARALLGLLGRAQHGLGGVHREVRLLDGEGDVEPIGLAVRALGQRGRVEGGLERADAAEVEHLLPHADPHQRRRVGLPVVRRRLARPADARQVEDRGAHVRGGAVVRRAGERLQRRSQARPPQAARDVGVALRRAHPRLRREQRRLVAGRVRQRLGQRHRGQRRAGARHGLTQRGRGQQKKG